MTARDDAAGRDAGVRIERVSKVFPTTDGPVHALDDVSLDIGDGEFVSIVGPSGCGKSTLLLIVAGLLHPSSGQVQIRGHHVERPYTDLGIVFQRDVLLGWRTALQNVLLQSEIRGLPAEQHRGRALELLQMVGLGGFENAYPSQLSGGMRQRVSLCRALVHDPPLLLMDEPFGALDALTRDQMNADLCMMMDATRKTVLFITHAIEEAVLLSDRVIVITPRPGRIERILDIDLPRPRRLRLRESAEFRSHVRQIVDVFHAVGVLSGE